MIIIETERLRLRLFQPDDLERFHTLIHSDPDVMRYITGSPLPVERTARVIEKYISHHAQHGYTVWAVIQKQDGRFVGHGGLMTLPNGVDVEIDYAFGRPYWGKGYATEVARAVMRYAFEEAGLEKVYALAFPENLASQRVMQKLGMTRQGRSRQFYDLDMEIYTLRAGDRVTGATGYRVIRGEEI